MARLGLKNTSNKGNTEVPKVEADAEQSSSDVQSSIEQDDTTLEELEAQLPAEPKKEKAPKAETGEAVKLSGIPMPEGRAPRESVYPWNDLEVGESFFVPNGKAATFHTLSATRNKKERDRNGDNAKKWVAKTYTHEGTVGVMVWRTQ